MWTLSEFVSSASRCLKNEFVSSAPRCWKSEFFSSLPRCWKSVLVSCAPRCRKSELVSSAPRCWKSEFVSSAPRCLKSELVSSAPRCWKIATRSHAVVFCGCLGFTCGVIRRGCITWLATGNISRDTYALNTRWCSGDDSALRARGVRDKTGGNRVLRGDGCCERLAALCTAQ